MESSDAWLPYMLCSRNPVLVLSIKFLRSYYSVVAECQYQSLNIYVYRYHDELVNSANDNKVDNKFYFYFFLKL